MSVRIVRRSLLSVVCLSGVLLGCGDDPVSSEPVATSFVVVSGSPQSVVAGGVSTPLLVRVLDQELRPMAGATVTWAKTTGVNGSVSANSTATNAAGEATIRANAGLIAGTFVVTATVAPLAVLQFTITVTPVNDPGPQDSRTP